LIVAAELITLPAVLAKAARPESVIEAATAAAEAEARAGRPPVGAGEGTR
jgi:hypothetical protein